MKIISDILVEDFCSNSSLRKPPTFRDVTTKLPQKMTSKHRLRNSMLMTCHYPDLGSASDWLKHIFHAERPIRSTTQIFVVTCHQYGISALVLQTSFRRKTSGGVSKCQLFSQSTLIVSYKQLFIWKDRAKGNWWTWRGSSIITDWFFCALISRDLWSVITLTQPW